MKVGLVLYYWMLHFKTLCMKKVFFNLIAVSYFFIFTGYYCSGLLHLNPKGKIVMKIKKDDNGRHSDRHCNKSSDPSDMKEFEKPYKNMNRNGSVRGPTGKHWRYLSILNYQINWPPIQWWSILNILQRYQLSR